MQFIFIIFVFIWFCSVIIQWSERLKEAWSEPSHKYLFEKNAGLLIFPKLLNKFNDVLKLGGSKFPWVQGFETICKVKIQIDSTEGVKFLIQNVLCLIFVSFTIFFFPILYHLFKFHSLFWVFILFLFIYFTYFELWE